MVSRDREWDWMDRDTDYEDDWTDERPKTKPNSTTVED